MNPLNIKKNDNSNNKFVNQSHILLKQIIKELDDNIDRICLSLTCKRLFEQRDKYLLFNSNNLIFKSLSIDNNDFENFHLKSYNNLLEHSKEIKTNCDLYLYSPTDRLLFCPKSFDYSFNLKDDINKLDISYSVNRLIFSGSITDQEQLQILKEKLDESNINSIDFGYEFNHPLKANFLSSKIDTIKLSYFFNHSLEVGSLPNSLVHLTFGYSFNQVIEQLPPNLKTIIFGESFNQPLRAGLFPPSLESITFGYRFSQEIKPNVLPPNLKSLTFGVEFSHELENNSLPTSLEVLNFQNRFNQDIKPGLLPPNLKELFFSLVNTATVINDSLPQSLETIINMPTSWLEQVKKLPRIKKIKFYEPIKISLTNSVGGTATEDTQAQQDIVINPGMIPQSVTDLHFGNYNYALKPQVIPSSVQQLNLSKCSIDFGLIPQHCSNLELYLESSQSIKPGSLPPNIKKLVISSLSEGGLQVGSLPDGIESLTIQTDDEIVPGMIPSSVKDLKLTSNFKVPLQIGSIAEGVENLCFDSQSKQPIITKDVIPSSVRRLSIHSDFLKQNTIDSIPTTVNILEITGINSKTHYLRRVDRSYFLMDHKRVSGGFIHSSYFNNKISN